jgi:hypothetical protein
MRAGYDGVSRRKDAEEDHSMLSVEKLIEESRDSRLHKLPLYARELIHDLAHRLDAEHRYALATRETAAREVEEARALLAEGPEGSDTFMAMPYSRVGDDEIEERPLGKGTVIEFRDPELSPGEGIEVCLNDGSLLVRGINHLAIVPVSLTSLRIETR